MRMQGTIRRAGVLIAGMLCIATAHAQHLDFNLVLGGFVGDGGSALEANLVGATDVVRDASGNLYVSQSAGNRIRKIAPDGTITTVVGGRYGFGGDGGPASQAKTDGPNGLAFDSAGTL